jgi:hypothetical protein
MKPGDMVILRDGNTAHTWEIVGVHLGALGHEGVVELRSLCQRPSPRGETSIVPVQFLKRCAIASAVE